MKILPAKYTKFKSKLNLLSTFFRVFREQQFKGLKTDEIFF